MNPNNPQKDAMIYIFIAIVAVFCLLTYRYINLTNQIILNDSKPVQLYLPD